MPETIDVEVFRAGDYGAKGVWDEDQLDALARDYDPALHEAPVTLDHAQRGPALGWVASVRRVGDRLLARLRGLHQNLLALVGSGAFKKRSVELYPRLRETGRPYLKAVSFLGAATPEVKGMADPLLPEAAGAPLFGDNDQERLDFDIAEETAPDPATLRFDLTEPDLPPAPSDSPDRSDETHGSDRTHRTNKSYRSDSSNASRSTPFLTFDEAADRLRRNGQWRPGWIDRGIEEFFRSLAAVDEIDVGDGHCVNPAEWFVGFLESLPPVVTMGETAPADDPEVEPGIPRGGRVDPASIVLHRAAVAFRQTHQGVDYAEALVRCAARR